MRRMEGKEVTPQERRFSSVLEGMKMKASFENILLVDDDPAILTVLGWNLKDLGFRVTTAVGGRGGFERLCEQVFGLLITDFVMEDLDGLSLVKVARLIHPDMKIILMTGSPHLIPKSIPLFCRFDALLEKPFRLDDFKDLIRRTMGIPSPPLTHPRRD